MIYDDVIHVNVSSKVEIAFSKRKESHYLFTLYMKANIYCGFIDIIGGKLALIEMVQLLGSRTMNLQENKASTSSKEVKAIAMKPQATVLYWNPRHGIVFESNGEDMPHISRYVSTSCSTTSASSVSTGQVESLVTCTENTKYTCFDRLYDRSEKKRSEGKQRRLKIEKEKELKNQKPKTHMAKISPKDAKKLYYRGVQRMIEFDERARQANPHYEPRRFRPMRRCS